MDPRDLREPWARPHTRDAAPAELMAFIRARCPWARAHTHASLAHYLVEESAELLAAEEELYGHPAAVSAQVDGSAEGGPAEGGPAETARIAAVEGEIADLLYQVLFHSALLDDLTGRAPGDTYAHAERTLADKLVRRHPHVFDSSHPVPLPEVQRAYRGVKEQEKSSGLAAPEAGPAARRRALDLMREASAAAEHKLGGASAPPPDDSSKEST